MNERFQQLLKQSTNPPWDGEQGPMNEFNPEEFAELIVHECAAKAFDYAPDDESACDIFRGIKKHFGVEE